MCLCHFIFSASGEFEESSNLYETVQTVSSFEDLCQSALAFYKSGKLELSFQGNYVLDY